MKRSLQLRKRFFAFLLALGLGMGTAYAFDFSAVCPTGQTLYYNIIDNTNHYVEITYPGTADNWWVGFDKPTGNITFPTSVGDNGVTYTVTRIGLGAFFECSDLTGSLTISNSVTTIGALAFYGCTGFTGSLTIPNSVTSIELSAFHFCSGLTGSLTLPDSIITIEGMAFYQCSGFTGDLTIPNSVTSIGWNSFSACYGINGMLTIGSSVTSIGDEAFFNCINLSSINVLPETPPTMGDDVFGSTPMSIPVNVPCGTLGAYQSASGWNEFTNMQEDCDPLTYFINSDGLSVTVTGHVDGTSATGELIIPEAKTINGITYTVTAIDNFAFANCSGLTGSLTIPNSVTTIGNLAFVGCTGFTGSLTLGSSLQTIGSEAFANCSGFTGDLVIPDNVDMIFSFAFVYCSGFTGSLTLGNSLFWIGDGAFANCSGFTGDLVIPDNVDIINDNAFLNCSGFTGSLTIGHSVTEIEFSAFKNCSGFTQVNFNATDCHGAYSVDKPFEGCGGTLTIGDNVQRIPSYMFYDCPGFTGDLVIPNSVTEIEERAFYCCTGFNGSLTIGNSVNNIGDCAFGACTGFSSLTIGSSVAEIGIFAFAWCSGLTSMSVYRETPPELGISVFEDVSTAIPVYVPCGSYSAYHNATGWNAFSNMREFSCLTYSINPDGVSVTVTGHVDGSAATGELIIPEATIIDGVTYAVTAIGEQAFDHCYYLTGTLNIPNSVTTIGLGAFYYCVGFTGLTLGNSVTTIGEYAFSNCENLTGSLTLPNSVTTLGNGAFGYCSGITSITSYPETPPTLGSSAFINVSTTIPVYVPCSSLEDYQTASGWSAFTNWHCICVPYSLPYAYGFEDAYEFDCWTMLECANQTGIYSSAAHEGSNGFRFYYNSNPPQYLISPEFEGTPEMSVSFYYRNALDRYPETFRVGYSTTTQSPSAFTWYEEVTANDQNTWMRYEDYFPEGTKYIAIKLTSYDQFYLYLDDFSFTPAPHCDAPTNLLATSVTSNSAEVHWIGEQDSYNVRYRTVPDGSWIVKTPQPNSFEDDFENGIDNWTLIDADGDGRNWTYGTISGGSPHGGSKMAYSFSWTHTVGALYPDNYLVTPCVSLGGTVTFWASAWDPNDFAEHFGIAVSTDSNANPNDFTMVQEWTMTAKDGGQGGTRGNRAMGAWSQYTVDLSAYAGQTGYIALRHFNCSGQFALAIDDFSYSNGAPGFTLVGLNPLTTYEVQVQNICPYGFSEWSEPVSFTTTVPTFPYGDYLGKAFYDLQSNSGARTWTHVWPDGKVNFAFTTSSMQDYSDRGTGIGTYDSANDVWIPSMGRVENERTGFGSIAQYGANGIVVAAHTNTSNIFTSSIYIISDKDDIAVGSAVKMGSLDSTHEPFWPNVMTSGANRDIIHVIAHGFDDHVLYYFRSRDGGRTWDRQNVILPYMGTDYCNKWMVNCCYWMETTEDNCLALVVNNAWSDGMVLYSYDDGDTWERKVFFKHPDPFGTFEDPIYYPRWTSCQWDSQHHLHVLYDLGAVDSDEEEYLDLGGVAYWNETMLYNANGTTVSAFEGNLVPGQPFVLEPAYLENDIYRSWWHYTDATHEMWPEYIGYLAPLTDDGDPEDPYQASTFNIENENLGQHGYYHSGVCSFPVLCMVPNSNEMVAVWSALDENHMDENGNYYYKIFASYSKNGGATWSPMVQLTKDFENAEFVYNQAAVVGRKLVIATQTDGEAGTYLHGLDTHANDCYYLGMVFDIDDLFDTSSSVQTIALSAGTNWFSTYLDITLDDLKAALREALPSAANRTIKIKSQGSGECTNVGAIWVGQLSSLDVAQMYKITVPSACEITIEGTPVNPADHPITIKNGANWIGFPFGDQMSVTDAFAGFPTKNDIIKSQSEGQAKWNNVIWTGALKNLKPGQGYIYNSAATGNRTFTFPTSAK